MDVSVERDGEGRFIIRCPREMRWDTRADLVDDLQAAAGDRPVRSVILDLDDVDYLNSAALGAVFTLRKRLHDNGGRLIVCRPNPTIARLLRTVNMPALIPVVETLDEARSLLDQSCAEGADDA